MGWLQQAEKKRKPGLRKRQVGASAKRALRLRLITACIAGIENHSARVTGVNILFGHVFLVCFPFKAFASTPDVVQAHHLRAACLDLVSFFTPAGFDRGPRRLNAVLFPICFLAADTCFIAG